MALAFRNRARKFRTEFDKNLLLLVPKDVKLGQNCTQGYSLRSPMWIKIRTTELPQDPNRRNTGAEIDPNCSLWYSNKRQTNGRALVHRLQPSTQGEMKPELDSKI